MGAMDLRSWISLLRDHGELVEIEEEVDWKYEMGCLIRRIFDIPGGGPAVIFRNIKDYHNQWGKEFFACSLSSYRRIAMAMGLSPDASYKEIVSHYSDGVGRPIDPHITTNASCKEVIHKKEDVDLLKFPVPYLHPFDGGRYMGTFHLVVTKDPDTGQGNVGMYRLMVHDENHLGTLFVARQHWEQHVRKWNAKGERMPIAICFGPPQIVLLTAMAKLTHPPDEYAYAGGLINHPIDLVKCETVDLEVPADSEIVLEGFVETDPDKCRKEGPFGEYLGYLGGRAGERPVIEVVCITHRYNPILQGTLEGRSVPGANEDHHCMSVSSAAYAYRLLKSHDINVVETCAPVAANGYNKIVVRIRQQRQGEAMQIASLLWGSSCSLMCYKEVVVVDEDIDASNPNAVEFAVATRVDPIKDITIVDGFPGIPLDPRIHPDEKQAWMGAGRWSRICIDATRPFTWPSREEWGGRKFPPVQSWPDEVEDLVEAKWGKYGLRGYSMPSRWTNTY